MTGQGEDRIIPVSDKGEAEDSARVAGEWTSANPPTPPRPREARDLTEQSIRDMAEYVRRRYTDPRPKRRVVAMELGVSESTLRRAMDDLGMGRWPPAPAKKRPVTDAD